jgi:DNA-binding MarR family transcriptional regulator
VTEAFETLHEQKEAEFAKELADALGIDESAVKTALEEQRAAEEQEHEQRRADFVKKLADKLGISESRVEDALPSMPHPPGHGPW